jgi:exopolysaccharide biosynthesis polyprenyl glycosylphosphotransferase
MTIEIRKPSIPPEVGVETSTFSRLRKRLGNGHRLAAHWAVVPLVFLDALCIAGSMIAAYLVRFELLNYYAPFSREFYRRLVLAATLVWPVIFALFRLYHFERLFGGTREYASVFNACTAGAVGLILYGFADRGIEDGISRGWLAMVWFFCLVSVSSIRFGYRRLVYALRERGGFVRRALVVGVNEEGEAVAAQLCASPKAGLEVVGFVDPAQRCAVAADLPILGSLQDLGELVNKLAIEELIVIPTALEREELLNVYRDWGTGSKLHIRLSSGLYELFTTGIQVKEAGFIPLLSLNQTRITDLDALLKVVVDYVGALLGIVLLAPVFVIIAILIRLDSSGPVIHRRRVVGLHGRRFDAFKFRTMITDADAYLKARPHLLEEWEKTGKIQDDPRVTRVGKLLRRYSLDELPQLVNVLRGQMSLVGPRMITPSELIHFGRWRHNLLTVKPGLTGLWQTSGRADLSYEERVQMDMRYIRNYTIWMDLQILLNTSMAVLRGKGAY